MAINGGNSPKKKGKKEVEKAEKPAEKPPVVVDVVPRVIVGNRKTTSEKNRHYEPHRLLYNGAYSYSLIVKETTMAFYDGYLFIKYYKKKDPEATAAFENELNLLRHAKHHPTLFPNILPLIDYQNDAKADMFFVTEIAGPNLNALRGNILKREFSQDSALRLSIQALEAIAALHRHDILHMSIEPSHFVIGQGANSCRLYLIGFDSMRKRTSKRSRDKCHLPLAPYAPVKLLSDVSERDDLEGWVFTAMDLFARQQMPWYLDEKGKRKKWSRVSSIAVTEIAKLSAAKVALFNEETFHKFYHVPEAMQTIGRTIVKEFNYNHVEHLDTLKAVLLKSEADMHGKYEWELPQYSKMIREMFFETEMKPLPTRKKDSAIDPKTKKQIPQQQYEDTDEEDRADMAKEDEMEKYMKKKIKEVLENKPAASDDEAVGSN